MNSKYFDELISIAERAVLSLVQIGCFKNDGSNVTLHPADAIDVIKIFNNFAAL